MLPGRYPVLFMILLAGCHSAQHTEFDSGRYSGYLEMSLIQDVEDGRLDMPLEHASLIASGVDTDKTMQSYLVKINQLIAHIDSETEVGKTHDPLRKAQIIFDWLQKNAYDGAYHDCYDFKDTLNLRVGNCLSYAIRFTVLCRHYGIDVKNIFIPGHIYNRVESNGQMHEFEHTHSDGIVKKGDKSNTHKKVLEDRELIAEIYLYKARNANNDLKYQESLKYCQLTLTCNPQDNRPVTLILDNYLALKNYNEAFRYLDDYLSQHPGENKSFQKTYNLLKNLCKKEDNRT
jgi:tetratricopeptide (TPR) repeat protein